MNRGDGRPCSTKANLYAQKLNNSAAFCIEIGQYDRAILSLGKALKLSALYDKQDGGYTIEDAACLCQNCSVEGCIAYSESIPANLIAAQESPIASTETGKKRRLQPAQPSQHSLFKSHPWRKESEEKELGQQQQQPGSSPGCIYRRPIQVSPQSIAESHNMGSTVYLLIIFNLALAHHQIALAASEDKRTSILQKTLKLYELADSCFCRYKIRRSMLEEEQQTSDRFEMILCNNASHVYRSLNNHTKCQECLERLTSALMLVVDHKLTTNQQQEPAEEETHEDRNCENEQSPSAEEKDRLDGFFQTAAQQILSRQCADAA